MKILYISDYLPFPLNSGANLRIFNLIKGLSRKNEITLCSLYWENDKEQQDIAVKGLSTICKRIETAPITEKSKLAHFPGLIKFALTGKPLETKFYYSPILAQKIHSLTKKNQYDIIQIEHSHMAMYIDCIDKHQTAKKILTFHNIIFDQNKSLYKIMQGFENKIRCWIATQQMEAWEPRIARRFDRCITVSERDRQLIIHAAPGLKVDVIPNGVDTKTLQPLMKNVEKPALIFVGSMDYPPAVDASVYFCSQVLPLIRKKVPEVGVWLVGRNPTQEIKDLGKDDAHIHVTGMVDSVIDYYEKATITIVPLRAGGGTRLKILESMALGKPIVSTSIGCEGINVEDGKNILIADTPELFSEYIIQLMESELLRNKITTEARKLVESTYDWQILSDHLTEIYQDVLVKK